MWKPWTLVRRCPRCGSFEVYRHRARVSLKRVLLQMVLVRHYSCRNCNSLYYGYLFSERKSGQKATRD